MERSCRRNKRPFGKGLNSLAHLEPGQDDRPGALLCSWWGAPLGSTGLSGDRADIIFDANDHATSCVLELTEDRAQQAGAALEADVGRSASGLLVEWRPRD